MSVNTSEGFKNWVNPDWLTDDWAEIINGGIKVTETHMSTSIRFEPDEIDVFNEDSTVEQIMMDIDGSLMEVSQARYGSALRFDSCLELIT